MELGHCSGTKLDVAALHALENKGGFAIAPSAIKDWQVLLGSFDDAVQGCLLRMITYRIRI